MTIARYRSTISASAEEVFAFYRDVANLPRISPPVPKLKIRHANSPTRDGDLQQFTFVLGPWHLEWDARIGRIVEGRLIEDVQERGPFRRWRHHHRVTPTDDGAELDDVIAFRLLPSVAGEFLEYWLVRPALVGMLVWRHRRTRSLLENRSH